MFIVLQYRSAQIYIINVATTISSHDMIMSKKHRLQPFRAGMIWECSLMLILCLKMGRAVRTWTISKVFLSKKIAQGSYSCELTFKKKGTI